MFGRSAKAPTGPVIEGNPESATISEQPADVLEGIRSLARQHPKQLQVVSSSSDEVVMTSPFELNGNKRAGVANISIIARRNAGKTEVTVKVAIQLHHAEDAMTTELLIPQLTSGTLITATAQARQRSL